MERRLTAIMATDVVGYTRLIRADEEGTLEALKSLRANLIDPKLRQYNGRIVKLMGDGMLAEFASVVDAVRAAVETQQAVAEYNAERPEDKPIEFRVGINLGDVVIDGDDIHGDGVNVAARLEGLAEPGGIFVSGKVYEEVRDRTHYRFEDLGEQRVKSIDRPVRIWRWLSLGAAATNGIAATQDPLPLPDKPSIAVLPFDNMSGDPEQEYFADGITEDIITEISKIAGLMVISRNSTFTYKGKAAKVQDVCRNLGVRYVLEGSVRKAGERVRITAQLIDGRSGGHLWADRYDRGLEDIFAVQDDVAEKIVRALEVKLVDGANAEPTRVGTDVPEAYDCVLRGREQYRLFSVDGNAVARELYERAIALAGLAETYLQEWFMEPQPVLDRAFELAEQAKARGPSDPLVQEALSTVQLFMKQHSAAIETARRWIEIEPSNADAYATLAGALHFVGENEEVIALIEKAMRLNPFYPFYYPHYIGLAHMAMRRYDEAAVLFKRSIIRNPEAMPSHIFLSACYGHMGEITQASAQLAELRRINPGFSIAWLRTFIPYKRAADIDLLVEGLRVGGFQE